MTRPVDLDSWGELYVGFNKHREILKCLEGADKIWSEAFAIERRRHSRWLTSDDDVAVATMKQLMEYIEPHIALLEKQVFKSRDN
jgi:hypothetical protein